MSMKAIRVNKFGDPEVLQLEDVPIPTPAKNQVLVKMHSVGINPVETYIRSGNHTIKPNLPYTPGQEGAGEVVSVGEGVSELKAGDRVWMNATLTGSYAQYSLCNTNSVHLLSDNLSYDQGAALWVAYSTSYHAIHHIAKTQPKSSILVHGASGGVGIASIQWARRIDCTIYGTAGTEKGLEIIKQQGAHHTYNHREENYMQKIMDTTNGKGIDVILEMLSNVNLGNDLKVLGHLGRVCIIGSRGKVEIEPRFLMTQRASVSGVALGRATPDEISELIREIQKAINDTHSPLSPIVGRSYKLEEATKAHVEIINPPKSDGGASGKLVFHPWE